MVGLEGVQGRQSVRRLWRTGSRSRSRSRSREAGGVLRISVIENDVRETNETEKRNFELEMDGTFNHSSIVKCPIPPKKKGSLR